MVVHNFDYVLFSNNKYNNTDGESLYSAHTLPLVTEPFHLCAISTPLFGAYNTAAILALKTYSTPCHLETLYY